MSILHYQEKLHGLHLVLHQLAEHVLHEEDATGAFSKSGRLTPPCTKIGHTSIEVYFLFMSNVMKEEIEIRCKMDKIDMLSVTWFWFVVSAVEQSLLPCSTLISSLNMHTCMKSCQHVHDPPRSSVVTGKSHSETHQQSYVFIQMETLELRSML